MTVKITTQVFFDPVADYESIKEYENNPKFHKISESTGCVAFEHSDTLYNLTGKGGAENDN